MVNENIPRAYSPDYASPPGDTLRATLDEIGMSQKELADRMGRHPKTINEIIKGKAPITRDIAVQFEQVLGTPARFWLQRETDYQLAKSRIDEQARLVKESKYAQEFPYAEMAQLNWIPSTRKPLEKASNLLSFFQVSSLSNLRTLDAPLFRKSSKHSAKPEALLAWLQKGYLDAKDTEIAKYDAQSFKTVLHEVRELTADNNKDFAKQIKSMCADCGVAVVYVPHLRKTHVNGACRWFAKGKKALIQLSIRYKFADIFWFSFFHEAGHLLRHSKKSKFVDFKSDSKSAENVEADQFASDFLIPEGMLEDFADRGMFVDSSIRSFADELGVSTGIVVGRLQHERHIRFNQFNHLRSRLKWCDE